MATDEAADNSADCLIGFGSNQGDSETCYHLAIAEMVGLQGIELVAASRLKQTVAVAPDQVQPEFLNGVIRLSTQLTLPKLFDQLVRIENQLGRIRTHRWGARSIDLDLLMYNSIHFESELLQVPHPRMTFRRFVLEPAVEVAGDMFHPIAQCTLRELLIELNRKPQHLLWVNCLPSKVVNIVSLLADRLKSSAINTGQLPEGTGSTWQVANWQISVISRLEDFESIKEFAKIVVWGYPRPEEMRGAQFIGAQLDLKEVQSVGNRWLEPPNTMDESGRLDDSESRIADEIAAAIQSCQPTCSTGGDAGSSFRL